VRSLKEAGFKSSQIGAYLLVGLPGQRAAAIMRSIDVVKQAGIAPALAYYSPIPGTRLWSEAASASRYDLASDPLFTNNAVWPCRKEPFSWSWTSALKQHIHA
jgi:hypothetical protein